jgi:hypothetical protein
VTDDLVNLVARRLDLPMRPGPPRRRESWLRRTLRPVLGPIVRRVRPAAATLLGRDPVAPSRAIIRADLVDRFEELAADLALTVEMVRGELRAHESEATARLDDLDHRLQAATQALERFRTSGPRPSTGDDAAADAVPAPRE